MNGDRISQHGAWEAARRNQTIINIAAKHLNLDTLDERGSDRLDFHELLVGSIRDALEAAYAAGAASVAGKAVLA